MNPGAVNPTTTDYSTTIAVDNVFFAIVGVSVLLLLIITVLMIYFVIKYNRKRHPVPERVKQSPALEIVWTLVPTVLVLGMFYYGFEGFSFLRDTPEDAMVVKVTGRMWDWTFEYENGKTTAELYVPVNEPVKLVLHSMDVIHSFYIPEFRVKEDAVPGKENYLWFKPQTTGPADVFCAEYCGDRHSYMMSTVHVMERDEFRKWYGSGVKTEGEADGAKTADDGMKLLKRKGCIACHSADGSEKAGPTFKGLYGSERTIVRDGETTTVTADDEYLRRAVVNPGDGLVEGFGDIMPPVDATAEEVERMIETIKTME